MGIPSINIDALNVIVDKIPLFQLTEIVVITIEDKYVKLVEMNIKEASPVVQNYALVKLVIDDASADPTDKIVDTIKSAFDKGGFKAKAAFAVVMGGSVFLKKITLPRIPKSELPDAIRWESTNHIPFNVETAYFDWEFLSTVRAREGVTNDEFMIAAIDKSAVDFLLEVYNKLNVKLVCIGLPAFALKNFVLASRQFDGKGDAAFVDIGNRKTNIVVFKGKTVCFAREIPVGVSMLDDILKSELHSEMSTLSSEYAENFLQLVKVKYDVMNEKNANQEIIKNVAAQRLCGTFNSFIDRIVAEMKRSFEYVRGNAGDVTVGKIVLSGIGSRLINIHKKIERDLEIRTEIVSGEGLFSFDQTVDVDVFNRNFQELVLPIGCALGRLAQINFMPHSFINERRDKLYAVVMSVLAIMMIVIGVFVWSFFGMQNVQLKSKLLTESTKVDTVMPQIVTLQTLCSDYAARRVLFDAINKEKVYVSDVLLELSRKIPRAVSLEKITVEKELLVLEGYVFEDESGQQTKENVLVDFIIALNESRFISQASLALSETGQVFNVSHNKFVVNCPLISRYELINNATQTK